MEVQFHLRPFLAFFFHQKLPKWISNLFKVTLLIKTSQDTSSIKDEHLDTTFNLTTAQNSRCICNISTMGVIHILWKNAEPQGSWRGERRCCTSGKSCGCQKLYSWSRIHTLLASPPLMVGQTSFGADFT